jgi:hypothetical protein
MDLRSVGSVRCHKPARREDLARAWSDPAGAAAPGDTRPPCIRKSNEVQGELLDLIGVVQAYARRDMGWRPGQRDIRRHMPRRRPADAREGGAQRRLGAG